jgi:alkylation response protein AidB-like acyl-CoA dehydrogenase
VIDSNIHAFANLPQGRIVDFDTIEDMIASEASTTDALTAFPGVSIKRLADAGLLISPLPGDGGNETLCDRLIWAGRSSLTVGRLYEGHVNAAVLLGIYGSRENRAMMKAAAEQGLIAGVWNAQRGKGVTAKRCEGGWILEGSKIFCSGAGSLRYPVITASIDDEAGVLMMMPDMHNAAATVDLSQWHPAGMRGTATGTVTFERFFVPDRAVVGQPGDYYRSPIFSGGAWRVLAVQFGGLQHIVRLHAQRLIDWGRCDNPDIRARFAVAAQNLELARLLVREASRRAADAAFGAAAIDAYVDNARATFEQLALAVIETTRRNIGLASFIKPDPLDLVIRDLETYLRQPFLDASRDNAAGYLLHRKGSF